MRWEPKDPIYYEKARQVAADYLVMKNMDAVCKKWNLSIRMVRHYLTLMGITPPPRKRDKSGRFISS